MVREGWRRERRGKGEECCGVQKMLKIDPDAYHLNWRMVTVAVKDNEEIELMLAKLHYNEFSSEKLHDVLDATRSELQDVDTEMQSLADQLTSGRQRSQQLHKELHDAEDLLHKEVACNNNNTNNNNLRLLGLTSNRAINTVQHPPRMAGNNSHHAG